MKSFSRLAVLALCLTFAFNISSCEEDDETLCYECTHDDPGTFADISFCEGDPDTPDEATTEAFASELENTLDYQCTKQ